MGQRTQIFIISTDKNNNHRVEVYHDQWGIGRRMPMLSMSLLTKLYCADMQSHRADKTTFLDLCKVSANEFGNHHLYTLDYNSNGDLTAVHTEMFKTIDKVHYRRYWGKVRSKSALKEYPQKFEYWDGSNTQNFGDFTDNFCDNNNGVMVLYCTETKNLTYGMGCDYNYKVGFLEGREDDGELGDAFEKWLHPGDWSRLSPNKRYMKDFIGVYNRFLDWYGVKAFGLEKEVELER